ncbi:MAG TPA: AraC family transcriptional regulator [Chitinophagaceae bacterium]|nr:AraC family transcriptional regulator [Chitinophagaceae bacterium]
MVHFKNLGDLHAFNGFPPPENPMMSLVLCKESCDMTDKEFTGDFYMIGFKKMKSGVIVYRRTEYDHSTGGSMYFMKPRQIIQFKDMELEEDGFAIFFHEDYLNGHVLHDEIKKYHYFDYEANEALHLSPREEQVIWELYNKINTEYYNNQDEYTKDIMLGHIASILKYAQRFYKRQFINRTEMSGNIVSRFNNILTTYFEQGMLGEKGLPTVKYMASQLFVSPRYLSDLLKQETGKPAMELIHIFLISEAKNLLKGADETIAEVAYALGFENLPYFSRLFKREVGVSPNQYKKQLLN